VRFFGASSLSISGANQQFELELQEFANCGPIEDKTSSNSTWNLASQWIDTCSASHRTCLSADVAPPPLPTRIIDIGPNEGIEPRLYMSGSGTKNAKYITLSHCWGSYVPMRLLENNISSMEKSIPFSQLSKTFQDVLIISKRLGIRYVWIDSLCIIQDSESDWQEQAALMSQFYSNSYLNIAAAHAIDGRQGCFSSRNPRLISPIKINLDWGPQSGIYYCVKAYFWKMNIFDTPLQRRGWACQERFLPPRTLHFGGVQLFWECRESSLCEQFPLRMPSQVSRGVISGITPQIHGASMRKNRNMAPDSSLDPFNVWDMIVGRYTSGALTHESDKLIAIAGLAAKMENEIGGQYLAGMWRNHLAYQLLWQARGQTATTSRTRPPEYRAPTWSWASMIGYIESACQVHFADERDIIISIIDANVELVTGNSFGQVKGGSLRLEGYLAKRNIILQEYDDNRGLDCLRIDGIRAGNGLLDIDSTNKEPVTRDNLYYLPIRYVPDSPLKMITDWEGELSPKVVGIVLRSTGEDNCLKFTREGQFEIFSSLDSFQLACRQFEGGQLVNGCGRKPFGDSQWGQPHLITIL